jgi:3-oxoacyl-[acyl-carrier protein] reductase
MTVRGKVAIITGGANGIGKAACFLFAEEGAKVVIADSNLEAAMAVKEEISLRNQESIAVYVNVTERESVDLMVAKVMKTYGRIDILINNAGIVRDKTLTKMTEEQFDRVVAVNLKGPFNVAQAVVPIMIEQQYGKIINTSSVVRAGNFGQTNYAATKAAIVAMTRTWAIELGKKGINVNAVAPGFIKTQMTAGMPADILKATEEKIPLKRLGSPEEIAEAYLFLASDKSNYINGTVLEVDGGLSL